MAVATLSSAGRYSRFSYQGRTITFMHGKDLQKYLRVKDWKDGLLVVDCLGSVKGEYEDYIDMPDILDKLYMNADVFLSGMQGVKVLDV